MRVQILIVVILIITVGCGLRYKNSEFYKRTHRSSTILETMAYINSLKDNRIDSILISEYGFLNQSNMSFVYYQHNGEYYLKQFTLIKGRQTFANPRARVKESKVIHIDKDKIFKYLYSNFDRIRTDSIVEYDLIDHPSLISYQIITNFDTLSFNITRKQYEKLTVYSARKQAVDSVLYFLNCDIRN